MKHPQHQIKSGERVAHSGLDDPKSGAAKTGVVEEVVGDEDGGVVIIRSESGQAEGYDRREIVPLRGGGNSPVILRPRHLVALIKRPAGILGLLLGLAGLAALFVWSRKYGWNDWHVIVGGIIIILVVIGLFLAADWSRRRKDAADDVKAAAADGPPSDAELPSADE